MADCRQVDTIHFRDSGRTLHCLESVLNVHEFGSPMFDIVLLQGSFEGVQRHQIL